jgi:hypothetical protein
MLIAGLFVVPVYPAAFSLSLNTFSNFSILGAITLGKGEKGGNRVSGKGTALTITERS